VNLFVDVSYVLEKADKTLLNFGCPSHNW